MRPRSILVAVGASLRLMSFARVPYATPSPQSHLFATLQDNRLENGTYGYGLVVDPGFAYNEGKTMWTASADVTLTGHNSFAGNPSGPAWFGMMTIWAALKPDCGSSSYFRRLQHSTFTISTPEPLTSFDYDASGMLNELKVSGQRYVGVHQNHPQLSDLCF